MITIVLAEDHEVVREGISAILNEEPDLSVIGDTGDGLEAVGLVEKMRPDVLITDLTLPGLHGLEVVDRVVNSLPETRVVVLSMHGSERYLRMAFQNGARAYVHKDADLSVLTEAVRAVVGGYLFLGPPFGQGKITEEAFGSRNDPVLPESYAALSAREREVLQLMAEGYTLKETAERLSISPRTVERHRGKVMSKLSLDNRAELVRYAVRTGLLGPALE